MENMSGCDLDRLFNPRTLAFIGASASTSKWGFIILFNILKGNYKGRLYPVNPRTKAILGVPCYPSVGDISEDVDLAIITTPAKAVPGLIDECGAKRIPYVIVVSADFSETGPEGARLEHEVTAKARAHGIRIVGPNTMGVFSSQPHLHALMPPIMPLHGQVSMFSQSGNLGAQMLMWGFDEGVGFEKFVGIGNEADLTSIDFLDYFARDERTRIILAYLEGILPNSGLATLARKVSRQKPILVFKGGRTDVGTKAAASHSGAMAGSTRVHRAAFHQAGIIEVPTSQGMMDCAKAFANYPVPRGNRVGILTRGGGWGVITADACVESGLEVPPLPDEIERKISRILPPYWSHGNPVDMVAMGGDGPFMACLETLAAWDGIDAILALGGSGSRAFQYSQEIKGPRELKFVLAQEELIAEKFSNAPESTSVMTRQLVEQTGKPIIAVSLGSAESHKAALKDYHMVSYPTPERAVRVLQLMASYRRFIESPE